MKVPAYMHSDDSDHPASSGETSGGLKWRRVSAFRDDFPNGEAPQRTTIAWLLCVGGLVQFILLRSPFPSDSLSYFWWAQDLDANPISHGTTRFGILIPVRAAIDAFGVSEVAHYLVPMVMHLVLVAATYLVATMLFSHVVGLVTTLLLASSTMILDLTGQIVPDPFAASWFTLGVASLLVTKTKQCPTGWVALAATCFGLAYLSRSYVIFLGPVVLWLSWTGSWKRRQWLVFFAILGGFLALEMALMHRVFGTPFARFQALAGFAELGTAGTSELLAAYGEGSTRWTVLSRAPKKFMEFWVGTALMLAVPATIIVAITNKRNRASAVFLLIWLASLWVPMMLLAGIFDPTSPNIRDNHIRYWFLIVPALFLMIALVVNSLIAPAFGSATWRRSLLAAVVVALGLLSAADVSAVPDNERFRGRGATEWHDVRDWLRDEGASVERIYIDRRMAMVLPIYMSEVFGDPIWEGSIEVYEAGGEFVPTDEMDGALLIHQLGQRYLRNRGLTLPADYLDPGPDWDVAVRRPGGLLTIHTRQDG